MNVSNAAIRSLVMSAWDLDAGDGWTAALVDTAEPIFRSLGGDLGSMVWKFRFPKGEFVLEPWLRSNVSMEASPNDAVDAVKASPSLEHLAAYYRKAPWSGLMAEALEGTANREHVRKTAAEMGVRDAMGLLCGDAQRGIQLQCVASAPIVLSANGRRLIAAMTAHISAALRLQNQLAAPPSPDEADAVLNADGDIVDVSIETLSSPRERLRSAVAKQRDYRDDRGANDGDPADSWESLVDGTYSIIDHFESDGRRLFLLFENPYVFRSPFALSPRQRDVVALAARGHDNRAIGLTLGLRASTIASHLAGGMSKLGIATRSELVRYLDWEADVVHVDEMSGGLRAVTIEKRDAVDTSVLTCAETDVAEMAASGATNAEIASTRKSRIRTVANQLASIYSKLGVNSRFELTALISGKRKDEK